MGQIATLTIDLNARLAGLQEGMDKAGRLTEKAAAQIEASTARARTASDLLKGSLAGIAAGFSVGIIVDRFKTIADGLDRLNDLSSATGSSVEFLSALEDIAERGGKSFDAMATALVKLNKELTATKPDSQVGSVFKQLGLDADELKKVDPAEALRRVAVELNKFADDGTKARNVQVLFGKSLAEVAPVLGELAKQGQLVGKVTAEQALAADEFNKALGVMEKNSKDASRALVASLLPAINSLLTGFTEATTKSREFFATLRKQDEQEANGDAARLRSERIAALTKLLDGQNLSVERRIRLEAQLKAILPQPFRPSMNYGDQYKPSLREPDAPKDGSGGKVREPKARRLLSDVVDEDQLRALRELERTDVNKIRDLNGALDRLFTLKRETKGDPAVVDAIARVQEQLAALEPGAKQAAEAQARLNSILAATPTGKMTEVLTDIDLINKAFAAGKISVEVWAEAVKDSTAKLPKPVAEALDEMEELAKARARGIQDALGDTVLAGLKGNFSSIGKLWDDLLLRMAAQGIAANLGKSLFGADFAKTGTAGGLLGDFLKLFSANGNAFDSAGRITAFASGGVFDAATPFSFGGGKLGVMAEAGPEAVLPLKRGPGGKLGVVSRGGSSVANYYTIDARGADAGVEARIQRAMSQVPRMAVAAVQSAANRGGSFAKTVGRR